MPRCVRNEDNGERIESKALKVGSRRLGHLPKPQDRGENLLIPSAPCHLARQPSRTRSPCRQQPHYYHSTSIAHALTSRAPKQIPYSTPSGRVPFTPSPNLQTNFPFSHAQHSAPLLASPLVPLQPRPPPNLSSLCSCRPAGSFLVLPPPPRPCSHAAAAHDADRAFLLPATPHVSACEPPLHPSRLPLSQIS